MADENVVVIDLAAKFNDQTDPGVSSATAKVDRFSQAIDKEKRRMDSMNRTKGQVMLEAKDKASSIVRDVTDKVKGLSGKTFSFTVKAVDLATKPMRSVLDFATSVKGIVAGIATGFAADKLVRGPIALADTLTNANIGFRTMLGSAKAAQKMMSDIQTFAIKTPFNTQDVISNTQMMMAYGFQAKDVIKDMGIIGDQAAATGRGSEGLQAIALALGQMQAHGRVDAQDMNQLTSVGVKGWDYLAQSIGKTKAQVMDMSQKGLIPADKGVQAILKGMQEFHGMMDQTANSTASGLFSQIQDTFDINILTKWGQGLQSGVIGGLSNLNDWIGKNQSKIAKWGDSLKGIGSDISQRVTKKVEELGDTVNGVVNSPAFKEAPTAWEKVKILWDKIVIDPFDTWWEGTGKKWLANKAEGFGQGLGAGLKNGILGILGVNIKGVTADGESVGSSFAKGFAKGFDAKTIVDGFKKSFQNMVKDAGTLFTDKKSSTSGLSAAAFGYLGVKGIKGAVGVGKAGAGAVKGIKGLIGLFGKGKNTRGSSAGGLGSFSTAEMNVEAAVVNLYGKTSNGGPTRRSEWTSAAAGAAGLGPAKPLITKALPSGGKFPALPSGVPSGPSLLGNGSKLLMSPAVQTLAKVGAGLGSGAATAGGSAAVGGGAILGGAVGVAGAISGGIDIYKGATAKNKNEQKEKYITGGTKLGMVGAGAAAGAAAGSVVPLVGTAAGALIGAGVGGGVALLGGDQAGNAISKSTDKGGWLNNTWDSTKRGVGWAAGQAGSGIGWAANKAGSGIGWAANQVGSAASSEGKKIGAGVKKASTTLSDLKISGANIATGALIKARGPAEKAWKSFSGWFDSNVSHPLEKKTRETGNYLSKNFNECKSNAKKNLGQISSWYNSHVATPMEKKTKETGAWIGDKFGQARSSAQSNWNKFSGWYSSNVADPVAKKVKETGSWIDGKFNEAKTNIQKEWGKFSDWYDSNVSKPVQKKASETGLWLQDKFSEAQNDIQGRWAGVSSWFDKNVWNPLQGGASSAGAWIGDRINDAKNGINGAKNFLAGLGDTGSKTTGLKTSTGKSSVLKHADGGFFDRPHEGLVAEAGPEAIIPLSSQRRQRGLDLWKAAGRQLGVIPYANGAIVGSHSEPKQPSAEKPVSGTMPAPVSVKVTGNEFTFKIEGAAGDPDAIISAIKAKAPEIANVLSYQIALYLDKSFSNRPARAD